MFRFGVFEADVRSGQLRKSGVRIALQEQPFRVLMLLLQRAGDVVTRDELQAALWAADTFVDFEHGVNVAIARAREALGDEANRPRFIETLPKRGYRFIAPVEAPADIQSTPTATDPAGTRLSRRWVAVGMAVAGLALVATTVFWRFQALSRPVITDRDTILVADFVNRTGEEVFDGTLKQAVSAELEQTPFLSIVPTERVRETLKQMTRSTEDPVIGAVAREVCQRVGARVSLNGSIAALGQAYVIGIEAVNCDSGETVTNVQTNASHREDVLQALGTAITQLRPKLGESQSTIDRFNVPLEQVTTNSLEALKAFSIAEDLWLRAGRPREAAPFLERAIELDRDFAMAYARLSAVSASLHRRVDETTYAHEAYARRERVTDRERLYIDGRHCVTRQARRDADDCWMSIWNLWKGTYPRDWIPFANLAGAYASSGDYEQALENGLEAIRLNPDGGLAYLNAVDSYIALDRYAEAQRLMDVAHARHVFDDWFDEERFDLAFIAGDETAMEKARLAVAGKGTEADVLFLDAEAAAFRGQLRRARVLRDRVARLQRKGPEESLAAARATMLEAAVGQPVRIPEAPQEDPGNVIRYAYAAAAALAGDFERSDLLLGDDEAPLESAPLVEACRSLIGRTEVIVPSKSRPMGQFSGFAPTYVRGVTYLRAGHGTEAAAEFGRIIDHRGVDPVSALYPLAFVHRARAYVLLTEVGKARQDYETFFAYWKDADLDVPILEQAKAEYARLRP